MNLQLIGQMNEVTAMLLPIGDNFTMGVDDAVKACEFVKPGMAVPIHYNTFPVIEADPDDFCSQVKAKGINCQVMAFGQEITL